LLGIVPRWGASIEAGKAAGELGIIEHAIRIQCCFISMVGCVAFKVVSIIWWAVHELAIRGPPQDIPVQEDSIPFNVIADKKSIVITTF